MPSLLKAEVCPILEPSSNLIDCSTSFPRRRTRKRRRNEREKGLFQEGTNFRKMSTNNLLLVITSFALIYQITNLILNAEALEQRSLHHHQQVVTNSSTNNNQTSNLNHHLTTTNQPNSEFLLNLVKTNFNSSQRVAFNARSRPGQQREHLHYKTTYACEGNQLELTCDEGKLIHLVRANYGRFSLSICNELGHSNLSVQCASFRAFLLVETRCNKLSNCSVSASSEVFGEPCEGTSKYLEVQYYCYDVNGQPDQQQPTSRPQQKQPQQQQQPQPQQTLDAPPSSSTNHKSPGANFVGGSSSEQQQAGDSSQDGQSDESLLSRQQQTVIQPQQQQQQQQPVAFCPPQTGSRNLYWNSTRVGQVARQSCPEGSVGKAGWLCDLNARFSPSWSADFSQCRSSWLQRLAQQLEQMLETPGKQSAELARQQNEQLIRLTLTDLALMARTKELFSEDLKRIDIMVGQIIAQLRSLAVLFGGGANQNFGQLYEELFNKLVNIVSSLFDISQRSAWLELQPVGLTNKLEQRFLNHLKEAGLLLASASQSSTTVRQANVLAGITVINVHSLHQLSSSETEVSELNLEQSVKNRQFGTLDQSTEVEQTNEFRINSLVLKELFSNGISKLLVLDIKKPDYALLRQQLELVNNEQSNSLDNNLALEQQWNSRIFGLFGILGETGDVFGENGHANRQQERKLAELLSQWPISIDFKVNSQLAAASASPNGQQQVVRQCNSLSGDIAINQQQQLNNRCHTFRFNATNHLCRCEQFGFVALTNNNLPTATNILSNPVDWPPTFGSSTGSEFPELLHPPAYVEAGPKQQQTSQSVGIWTSILLVLGLCLLGLFTVAFVINSILKASSQSKLAKKQGFLSAGSSILGNNLHRSDHLTSTTGPLPADHTLEGNSLVASLATSGTTQSTSIIGLNQSACQGYKTHQQLYAAHMSPPLDHYAGNSGNSGRLLSWFGRLLRPRRLLSALSGGSSNSKGDHLTGIQHRVMGSHSLGQASSVSYKSQFQNGYTTNLHQSPLAHLPLAAPSSSTSSYVSSSAYYEEIGPGNITKVGTSQLTRPSHTIVDPFKSSAADQQQLLGNTIGHHHHFAQQHHHHQQQHQQHPHQFHPNWNQQMAQPELQHQQTLAFSRPLGGTMSNQVANNKQLTLHSDLSHLQLQQHSSSSSAGSQHSASTSITNATNSTPRHYLFASPSGVSAYKSSMSQHTLQHLNKQTTAYTNGQQQFHKQDHQQRFMPD